MLPLNLIITAAGLDKLVDAENGDTDPIVITQVGLSATPVVAAPTLELLPGEFKRLGSVAGDSVAANVIHMTVTDASTDVYDLLSIGLYLSDGTLFAAYGQEDPIFRKVSIADFLLAFDVAFNGDIAGSIEFGDTTFLYPPATETVKGVAEIATQAETNAGADDTRMVTPLKLWTLLTATVGAAIAALTARTITGAGLATGGGDLSANRVITVTAATLAETNAGVIANKAVVPSGLATILANIAALFARTITGGGLVTGGGDLNANRVLTVTAATGSDIAAGTDNAKAVTPAAIAGVPQSFGSSIIGLGGAMMKMGTVSVAQPGGGSVTFAVAFPNACDRVLISPQGNPDDGDENDEDSWVGSMSASGFNISTDAEDGVTATFAWVAWGH